MLNQHSKRADGVTTLSKCGIFSWIQHLKRCFMLNTTFRKCGHSSALLNVDSTFEYLAVYIIFSACMPFEGIV